MLADDHEILLDSLEKLIVEEPGLRVVAKARNGAELLRMVRLSPPDLCILDMQMPGMSGMETAREILREFENVRVIILSMFSEPSIVRECRNMGIQAYLLKTCDREEFIFTIRQVMKGKTYFAVDTANDQNDSFKNATDNDLQKAALLSRREREIVSLLCEGLTNRQIAEKLFISLKTVDNHRASIMRKLDCHNVVELIRFCLKNGIVKD